MPILWPLVPLYAAGVRLKNAAFDSGAAKSHRLSHPVISVGNLSVGGTGKTPLVLLLAELLKSRGWEVDVLSRGYGREDSSVARVDSSGSVGRFGDEPLMIARHGIPVYVGADRYEAGRLAEQEMTNIPGLRSIHLLDDGFQHRKLSRAVDIVLLDRRDLSEKILPAGRLREPIRSLERADICVLRAEDADLAPQVLARMLQADSARVWIVERQTVVPFAQPQLSDSSVLAFCAIGDPDGFFRGLERAGTRLAKTISFLDHHVYTSSDIARLNEAAKRCDAASFITTEKDSMRLTENLRAAFELPVAISVLRVALQDEVTALNALESLLAEKSQKAPRGVR